MDIKNKRGNQNIQNVAKSQHHTTSEIALNGSDHLDGCPSSKVGYFEPICVLTSVSIIPAFLPCSVCICSFFLMYFWTLRSPHIFILCSIQKSSIKISLGIISANTANNFYVLQQGCLSMTLENTSCHNVILSIRYPCCTKEIFLIGNAPLSKLSNPEYTL